MPRRLSRPELAERLTDMIRRREPRLMSLVEQLTRSKEGLRSVSEIYDRAYETYVLSGNVETAYNELVRSLLELTRKAKQAGPPPNNQQHSVGGPGHKP